MLKFISWNVNGLRACYDKGFVDVFHRLEADFFCLQETKMQEGQLDAKFEGYHSYWNYAEKKGYSGTAIFSKVKPLSVTYGLGIEEHDHEGRVITLELESFYLITVYTPNSQEELRRLDYRMKWEDDFRAYLKKLEEKIIPRLAETRFALIEFSMGTPYKEIHTALDRLLHLGVTPVVAHIERYKCLEKNEERVQEMIDMGCYMQINSSSVLKPRLFGDEQKQLKKRARYFLEKDLVHFVASDMHNVDKRPPYMAEAYHLIKEEYGEQRAQALFVSNQELLLADELI